MNIVLLNNHSLLNAGDHAILLETLDVLEQAFPGARVSLAFNDVPSARAALPGYHVLTAPLAQVVRLTPERSYAFAPDARRAAVLAGLALGALSYRLTGALPPLPQEQRAFLRALAEADIVLACGGGYIYAPSGEQTLGWFTFMILGCLLALLLGRPLVLLPQSIGPLHGARQHLLAAAVARLARLTLVRERISLDVARALGAGGRALCAPDMAFGMAGAPPEEGRALLERAGLGALARSFTVGVTALNWAGQNHTFAAQERYEQAMVEAIDAITAQGAAVVLFAQCCGPSAVEDDRIVSRRIHARLSRSERAILLDEPLPPRLLQAAYGQMDCFIGTRMHSAILALNAGVPTVAVGYLHKTQGMLAELGLAHRALDIGTVTAAQIVGALERLRAEPPRPAAEAYLARARRVKRALPALLRGILARGGA